jgi:hypothetical protein
VDVPVPQQASGGVVADLTVPAVDDRGLGDLARPFAAGLDGEAAQRELGDTAVAGEVAANPVNDDSPRRASDA